MSEKDGQRCSSVCVMSYSDTIALNGTDAYSTKCGMEIAAANVDCGSVNTIADYVIHAASNIIMHVINQNFGKGQKREAQVITGLFMVSSQITKMPESVEKQRAQKNYAGALRYLVSQKHVSLTLFVSVNDKVDCINHRLLNRLLDIAKNADYQQKLLQTFQLTDINFFMHGVDDKEEKKTGIYGTLVFRNETSSHDSSDIPTSVQFPIQVDDVSKKTYVLSFIKKYYYPDPHECTIEGDFVGIARIAEKLDKARQQALIGAERYQKANNKLNESITNLLHDITQCISGVFELNDIEANFNRIYQYIDVVKKEHENRNEEYKKWQKWSLQYIDYAKKFLDNTLTIQDYISTVLAIAAGLNALGDDYAVVASRYLGSKGFTMDSHGKIKAKFSIPSILINGKLADYNFESGSEIAIFAEAERCYLSCEKTEFICQSHDIVPAVDSSLEFEVKQIIEQVIYYKNSGNELIKRGAAIFIEGLG